MSVNDAIKDMLYGHEHRWRVAEHELAQARSEVARLTAEVEAMRAVVDAVNAAQDEADNGTGNGFGHYCDAVEKARALRARKVGG